jgi:diguanylate cyclase (GGDEF)-like protein
MFAVHSTTIKRTLTMAEFDTASRDALIAKIHELQTLVDSLREDKVRMEQLLEEQNQQLLEMTTTDYLTQVYNRRGLFERLDYEMRRAGRNASHLSVLLIDIDHFKHVNDTYGHAVGDKVLVELAGFIKKSIRNTDIVGRFGGEEFLVILPECARSDGFKTAEKIRVGVQNFEFSSGIRVTISGGVHGYQNRPLEELLDVADKCLYLAKHNGRNRIECTSNETV